MLKKRNTVFVRLYIIFNLFITAFSFFLSYAFIRHSNIFSNNLEPIKTHYSLFYLILPIWTILLYKYISTQTLRTIKSHQIILPVLKVVVFGGAILLASLFLLGTHAESRSFIACFLIINFFLIALVRISVHIFLKNIRRKNLNFRNIVIVGTGERARDFVKTLSNNRDWGLNVIGYIDKDESLVGKKILGIEVIGCISDFSNFIKNHQVDKILYAAPRGWLDEIMEVISYCQKVGIEIMIACDFFPWPLKNIHTKTLGDKQLVAFAPYSHCSQLLVVKRTFDILFSLFFLLLTFPLFILISLITKITSPGPVFFKQERCGINCKKFTLYKFRTMVINAEKLKTQVKHLNEMKGPIFKVKKDPRITPLGKFLRKFSLDELPQFLNVLNGDMSIVGPRPPIPSEVDCYDTPHRRRLSMKPGITCLWQIMGRNKIGFEDWVKLDLKYIDNWSLGLDLKIALLTIPEVFKGSGM